MDKRLIAEIRHFAWTCYQLGAGQPYNETPTEEQIQSQVNGLEAFKQHPDMTAEENHENWMRYRLAQGWKYGPIKDGTLKTHPDLVPFSDLPEVEKRKDIMDIWSTRFALRLTSQSFETLEAQLAEAKSAIRAYRRVLVECREKMGEVCEQKASWPAEEPKEAAKPNG